MRGSGINHSHEHCGKVQDAYSLRCAAQVHGATREALRFVRETVAIEANSATDNPMVFADTGDIVSGGNFHGAPIAIAADLLAAALVPLATISERRTDRLVDPSLSGLPAFLTRDGGLKSGYMMAQVTAAAVASEMKSLAHPAGVDTIPTSANKEDHVSMSMTAALKAETSVSRAPRGDRDRNPVRLPGDRSAGAARHLAAAAARPPAGAIARADARRRPPPSPDIVAITELIASERARRRVRRTSQVKNIFIFKLTTFAPLLKVYLSRSQSFMTTATRTIRSPRGTDADLQRLAAGSRAADADEQSRSRGRRAARRSRRLRRIGQGGAQLGIVRRDRALAADARARRDAAGAVGQAGRRLSDPSGRAARADRQLAARAGLGDLGKFPRPRTARPDDVRPDDRRQLDLHRQPGHRAGHLRNAGRGRAAGISAARSPAAWSSPPASAAWAEPSRWPRP